MTPLPIIVRELRAESRRPFNYGLRALGAAALLVAGYLAVYSHASYITAQQRASEAAAQQRYYALRANPGAQFWVSAPAPGGPPGPRVFGSLLFGHANAALFLTLWILVPLLAADSLNREKRDGTLGLLFLTPLTPLGVVTGKCFVHGLRALTLFLTALPILTLPVLLGGISPADVLMAVLLDANALVLALAAGLVASCLARDPVRTVILAEVLSLLLAAGFMSLHVWSFRLMGGPQVLATGLGAGVVGTPVQVALLNPGIPSAGILSWLKELLQFNTNLVIADHDSYWGWGRPPRMMGFWSDFWAAAKPGNVSAWFQVVAGLTGVSLLSFLAVLRLAAEWVRRSWREQPSRPGVEALRKTWCEPRFWNALRRLKRTRTMDRNPIAWLQQYSLSARLTKWGWCLFIILAEAALVTGWQEMSDAQFYLATALLGGLAFSAASSFRHDRDSGALELLLVTPLQARQIISGRLLGLWIQFLPAVGILSSAWLFSERFLTAYPWTGWALPELRGLILLWSSFLSLPAVGLLASLLCRTLLGAWMQTCLLGLAVPSLLAWAIQAIGNTFSPSPPSPSGLLILLVVAQAVTVVIAVALMPARLRRVRSGRYPDRG